ncbi:MAG: right-handed parallel beta-helix repeat-containing protein [Xanthomonadales bacterium]|nr:right-handed parallel beta-helix repeat-containing protein [Xanthomonadales bacterium]
MALAWLSFAAAADTFVVSNVGDSGFGSLRQAVLDANAIQSSGGTACPRHRIEFAIPGEGPHTIHVESPLPPVTVPVELDGYSQAGAMPNTLVAGTNAVLKTELDGRAAGVASAGIVLAPAGGGDGRCGTSGSIISGLAIGGFGGAAIHAAADDCPVGRTCAIDAVRITGNFIGTDASGQKARGNGIGVLLGSFTQGFIIGDRPANAGGPSTPGPGTRNLIAASVGDAIHIVSPLERARSVGHVVRGNYIGVDATGTAPLGNGGHGVFAGARAVGNRILENIISANGGDGVRVLDDTEGAWVRENGIGVGLEGHAFGNAGHGVAIGGTSSGTTVGGWFPPFVRRRAAIAHNGGAGLWVEGEAVVDVTEAYIADNTGLAIDLAPEGVNAPGADGGPNHGIEAPLLVAASSVDGISGSVRTVPDGRVSVMFYESERCHPSGYGDGGQPLGGGRRIDVVADMSGHAEFTTTFPVPPGTLVTAMARRFAPPPGLSVLEVSEFSRCLRVQGPDPLFADGFEMP